MPKKLRPKRCNVCLKRRIKTTWTCRMCGRLACQHYCNLKGAGDTAICFTCSLVR